MLGSMNRYRTLKLGKLLLKVGGVAIGLVITLISTIMKLLFTSQTGHDEERRLHDSGLSGELNHRTGRLDSGLDPYGWYDRD